MKSKRITILVFLCIFLLVALVFVAEGADKKAKPLILRLAHNGGYGTVTEEGQYLEHRLNVNYNKLSQLVWERTNGEILIKVYPAGQLGGEEENIEMVRAGIVEMINTSGGPFGRLAPSIQIIGLPFLWKDFEHLDQALEGELGEFIAAEAEEKGVKVLAFAEDGFRWIQNNVRPVNTIEDVKGLKIRVQSAPIYLDIMKALGANPITLSWGEVYTSLDTGVIDGVDNDALSAISAHQYEVLKYCAVVPVSYSPHVLMMGLDLWNSLSAENQEIISESAREAARLGKKYGRWQLDSAINQVKNEGMEITYPDPEPFREATKGVYEKYFEEHPEWRSIVEKVQALVD